MQNLASAGRMTFLKSRLLDLASELNLAREFDEAAGRIKALANFVLRHRFEHRYSIHWNEPGTRMSQANSTLIKKSRAVTSGLCALSSF